MRRVCLLFIVALICILCVTRYSRRQRMSLGGLARWLTCGGLLSLVVAVQYVYAADPPAWSQYTLAGTELLGSNVALSLFDRLALDGDYAKVGLETWKSNLTGPWIFDEDAWTTNELGHPFQGSFYFVAGRANGLDFWSSAAGTVLGSATWELFGETGRPDINDLVSTSLGGVTLGEIFHRIGADAVFGGSRRSGDGPAARGRPVSLSLEAGFVFPFLDLDASRDAPSGYGGVAGEIGDTLIYGEPFGEHSAPFDYFEQRMNIELSPSLWGFSFFSNGALFTIPLADSRRNKLALASCLHYDMIYSSIIELSANSLGLSLLTEQRSDGGLRFAGEVHLNAVVIGTNENAYLRELNGVQLQFASDENRDYDFGFGEEAKLYLDLSQPRFGSFDLEYAIFSLNGIPTAIKSDAPFECALIGVLRLAYEHSLSAQLSLGSAYTLYHKDAFYRSLPNVHEYIQAITLYVKLSA